MLGMILAGGGARGAYEAGVLRFVFEELSHELGEAQLPRVVCGTSVGALNAVWLCAFGADGARRMSEVWRRLEPEHIYQFTTRDLVSLPGRLVGAGPTTPFAMFDPAPLYRMMRQSIDWNGLHTRIDRGDIQSFIVAATDVASGQATLFADGAHTPRPRPATHVRRARIRAEHCLASAAIPFVFPPVAVDGRHHVDGSLRQNTPLAPAIAAGVTRALVIGVKQGRGEEAPLPPDEAPTPAFLAGKALNALMLDPVEDDLRHLREINELLQWGEATYPGFQQRLQAEVRPYRHVETVFIRPSEDIGRIAADVFRRHGALLPWATRMLIGTVAGNSVEADLASYLYFHRSFTAEIEQLGYEDARRREDELAELFSAHDEDQERKN
jgi:NTE family protein